MSYIAMIFKVSIRAKLPSLIRISLILKLEKQSLISSLEQSPYYTNRNKQITPNIRQYTSY